MTVFKAKPRSATRARFGAAFGAVLIGSGLALASAAPVGAADAAPQQISWGGSLPSAVTYGQTFGVGATASSGLPVSITTSGPCIYLPFANEVTTSGEGTCTVMADQTGDADWLPAPELTASVALIPLTVTSSADPSSIGESIALTATSVATRGTVRFYDGATLIGAAGVKTGVGEEHSPLGSATMFTAKLGVGDHAITAVWTSGEADPIVTPPITQEVDPALTSTSFSSSMNPSAFGKAVRFKVEVVRAGPARGIVPNGDLFLYDGDTLLGSVPLKNGDGSFVTNMLIAGNHQISVLYGGSTTDVQSRSSVLAQAVE